MNPLFASVGPATGFLEAVAASIGFGVVIGGFFGGIDRGLRGRPTGSERWAVLGSYAGGLVGLLALGIDSMVKHFV